MKKLYVLVLFVYVMDMVSTHFSMPDLKEEGNPLVQKFKLNIEQLWVVSMIQMCFNLLLVRIYYMAKNCLGNSINTVFFNPKWNDSNLYRFIFFHVLSLFCFSFTYSIILLKLFVAIPSNFLLGIYKFHTFEYFPMIQNLFNACHVFLWENRIVDWLVSYYVPILHAQLIFIPIYIYYFTKVQPVFLKAFFYLNRLTPNHYEKLK